MSKYIDADRLKNGIMQYADKYGEISCGVTAFNILLERFAADVQEVRHGRWLYDEYGWECSECGYPRARSQGKSAYCPNCGSRMDLEEE